MADREKVFDALRNCVTQPKFFPWEDQEKVRRKCVKVPIGLLLDTLDVLKEQQETIVSLQGTICKLNAALAEQPEQKHGHWEIVQDYYDDEHWQCSACGCEWYLEAGNPKENNMLYCPECGAKMDEEVKQNETD